MAFDVHSLEGYSTISIVSGTNPNLSIAVQPGDGTKFGNPQNVTIWPANSQPSPVNSTIGRISGILTDILTVTTAQEGSSNITVVAGMQIANTITPKVLTDIEAIMTILYPVGAIYISTLSTNPATLLGFGTWAAYAAGRVLVGVGTSDQAFAAAATGGESNHTLSIPEMPTHNHEQYGGAFATAGTAEYNSQWNNDTYQGKLSGNAGGGGAHNNLQPYVVVYMWNRTA